MARHPNGWFYDGMILWGEELTKRTVVAKGFYVELPQVLGSDIEAQNQGQDVMRTILTTIGEGWAMQWYWTVDGNYRGGLDHYDRITQEAAARGDASLLSLHHRTTVHQDGADRMRAGLLRREVLCCFFSKRCAGFPRGGLKNEEHVRRYLASQRKSLEDKIEQVQIHWPQAKIQPMDDPAHYAVLRNFFNPADGLAPGMQGEERRNAGFRPDVDVMSQVFSSDMVSLRTDEGVAFKMDHHYFALFVATRWPSMTDPSITHLLTKRLNSGYWISVNVYPLSVPAEVRREEAALRKITLDALKPGNYSMRESVKMKQRRIDQLQEGYTFPFKVTYVVGVFDKNLDGLAEKCASLKGAFQDMNGMQCHQCNEPAQMKNLLLQVIPGWMGGPVRQWDLYATSQYLPDLLPASTTFTGHLLSGETLNPGAESNLVGTQSFANGMSQHRTILGINGSGKTTSVIDWALQSEPFFQFTAIIEEGLNYGIYAAAVGGTSIIIRPGGHECINYLDTLGLPLSAESRSLSVALCMKMLGTDPNPQRNNTYRALLGDYLNKLYAECVEDFLKETDDEDRLQIAREAYGLWNYLHHEMQSVLSGGDPVLDAFTEVRDRARRDPAWYGEYLGQFEEDDVLKWSQERDGKVFLRNYTVSKFSRQDYVTFGLRHAGLIDKLRSAESPNYADEDRKYVGNMLAAWKAGEGAHGGLFDGATNVRLDGGLLKEGARNRHQVVHFDLSYIPEAETELRNLAGFLVSSYVRQHVITLPRGQRKRFIFEELARFLNVEEGARIVAEAFAQLRKYNCMVATVFQNYGAIKSGPLVETIFSNAKTHQLMRQKNARDLDEIGDLVGLPGIARHQIMRFRLVEQFGRDEPVYSSTMYFAESVAGTICGPYRVQASPELLWVSDCSGEKFDRKMKALRQHLAAGRSVYEAVLLEAYAEAELEQAKRPPASPAQPDGLADGAAGRFALGAGKEEWAA